MIAMPHSVIQHLAALRARGISWGGSASPGTRRINFVLAAVLAVALAAGGGFWWRTLGVEREFQALAAQGQAKLAAVESLPSHGGGHLSPGASHSYADSIPTSGVHDPSWVKPGFYEQQQPQPRLVHALEHGNVIVYYEHLEPEPAALLSAWTGLYDDQWDGVIAAPLPGLGDGVVLAAWTKLLRLERFDAAAAAAFIDRFRGRGPENAVR